MNPLQAVELYMAASAIMNAITPGPPPETTSSSPTEGSITPSYSLESIENVYPPPGFLPDSIENIPDPIYFPPDSTENTHEQIDFSPESIENLQERVELPSESIDNLHQQIDKRRCFVVINEVLPHNPSTTSYEFIEIAERCGSHSSSVRKSAKLDGYVLLAVRSVNDACTESQGIEITFAAYLGGNKYWRDASVESNKRNRHFSIGSSQNADNSIGMLFSEATHINSQQLDQRGSIPKHSDTPSAVILLYLGTRDRTKKNLDKVLLSPPLYKPNNEFEPRRITHELEIFISKTIVDIFIYGSKFESTHVTNFQRLSPKIPSDFNIFMYSSDSDPNPDTSNILSFSRCGESNLPYVPPAFKKCLPSAGFENLCSVHSFTLKFPFQLARKPLQSTAMKLIINCEYALKMAMSNQDILHGSPYDVTARILGIGRTTVFKTNQKLKANQLLTPKKRYRNSPVMSKIDSFDRDFIRRKIVDSFKQSVAPDAKRIYDQFMEFKREQEQREYLQQIARSRTSSSTCPTPQHMRESSRFQCSMKTFKKLLRLMGYRYKKIDDRAAILQRPDLTKWRGMYLKRLRENDALPNPKKLVYIDETWVDTNARISKGWIPNYFEKYKDMAAYSYDRHKVGRGLRLIVLAAVTVDGIISESVVVYKVSAKATAEDYHKNVGKEEFMKWFKALEAILSNKGGEYLIIMDNASSKATPRKSERKQVLYDYIKAQIDAKRVTRTLPAVKTIRKWELENILDEIVQLPSMRNQIYELDLLAAKRRNEIVRLPPYHCHLNPIELVWKDVKVNVKKENTEQKIDLVKPIVEKELRSFDASKVKGYFQHVDRLRGELWEEDGYFELTMDRIVITDDDEDDDEDCEDDDDDINSADADNADEQGSEDSGDNVPYGDDTWILEDRINYECEVFQDENDLSTYMVKRPKKRARTAGRCATRLFPMEEDE